MKQKKLGKIYEEIVHHFLMKRFSGYTASAGNIFGFWHDEKARRDYTDLDSKKQLICAFKITLETSICLPNSVLILSCASRFRTGLKTMNIALLCLACFLAAYSLFVP